MAANTRTQNPAGCSWWRSTAATADDVGATGGEGGCAAVGSGGGSVKSAEAVAASLGASKVKLCEHCGHVTLLGSGGSASSAISLLKLQWGQLISIGYLFSIKVAMIAFCTCRRFSASSNTTECEPSITSSLISSPR